MQRRHILQLASTGLAPPPADLSVLSFASAGLDVYGDAVLASTKRRPS